ncbi:hypothetical protein C8J57DRAFT_1515724 [Mycena rebaudengoi]|nr:hypothetical protein C8J57DRAFT_1515724 [Mycena rebaudengoi]
MSSHFHRFLFHYFCKFHSVLSLPMLTLRLVLRHVPSTLFGFKVLIFYLVSSRTNRYPSDRHPGRDAPRVAFNYRAPGALALARTLLQAASANELAVRPCSPSAHPQPPSSFPFSTSSNAPSPNAHDSPTAAQH